ncbi:MAG: carboxypeptidase-like regulatory domain-containing protein, partial [Flavisolibacter sp.]|nr:carboxypeptidase-like regulatory domain-containing protein [Flavisolibacter sp.]
MSRFAKPNVNFRLLMKVSFFFLTVTFSFLSIAFARNATGQEVLEKKIDLELKNVTYNEVLTAIEKKSGVKFVYQTSLFQSGEKINVVSKQERLKSLLDRLLASKAIQYELSYNNFIVLTKGKQSTALQPLGLKRDFPQKRFADTTRRVYGKVMSKDSAVAGASVMIEGTQHGTTTDNNGNFEIHNVSPGSYTLIISHVGFANLKQKITVSS